MGFNIAVRGAMENNLRSVDADIPHGRITVITGVSGSGKSSLAFDVIYKEAQRRYLESFSTYARQFMENSGVRMSPISAAFFPQSPSVSGRSSGTRVRPSAP